MGQGKVLTVQDEFNAGRYVDSSKNVKFEVGEGCVGKVFTSKKSVFTQDVSDAPKEFVRKSAAMDEGLQSLLFVNHEDSVVELGYFKRQAMQPRLAPPPDHGGYVVEVLLSCISFLDLLCSNCVSLLSVLSARRSNS